MATNQESPFKVYTILASAVTVVVLTILDYKASHDIASDPYARPLAYTSEDFDRFYEHQFEPVRDQLEECRQNVWRDREMFRNLERTVHDLQSQVLYLYQQEKKD